MICTLKWWRIINANGEARVRAALVVKEGVPHTIEIDRDYKTPEGAINGVKRILARYGHKIKKDAK